MGAHITIQFEGIQEMMKRLSEIEEKAEHNLETEMKDLADDTKTAWKENTPKGKTGRLQDEEDVPSAGLEFTLQSPTRYYKFVDEGHDTPRGWRRRTKDGRQIYVEAKRRSHVKGREMTKKATDFVNNNLERRLSRFLDNV